MGELAPGTLLRHKSGALHIVREAKAGGDGWWLCDGSGLSRAVFHSGDWQSLGSAISTLEKVRALTFHHFDGHDYISRRDLLATLEGTEQ